MADGPARAAPDRSGRGRERRRANCRTVPDQVRDLASVMIPASSLKPGLLGGLFDTAYAAPRAGEHVVDPVEDPLQDPRLGSGRPVIGSGSVRGGPPRRNRRPAPASWRLPGPGRLLGQPLIDREPLRQLLHRRPAGLLDLEPVVLGDAITSASIRLPLASRIFCPMEVSTPTRRSAWRRSSSSARARASFSSESR